MREFLLQSSAHRSVRLQPSMAQLQKVPHFLERKSQALYAADESQRFDIRVRVLAKTTSTAWRAPQQRIALIKTDCIGSKADLLCDSADVHCRLLSQKIYTLEYSPESRSILGRRWCLPPAGRSPVQNHAVPNSQPPSGKLTRPGRVRVIATARAPA